MTKSQLEKEVSVLKEKLEALVNGQERKAEVQGSITPKQAEVILEKFVKNFKGDEQTVKPKKGTPIWLLDKPLWDLAFGKYNGWTLTDKQVSWAARIMNGAYCKDPDKIKQHVKHYENLAKELKVA